MLTPTEYLHKVTSAFAVPCLVILALGLSACSGSSKWKEEVQLSDGRVIVVERELLRESGGDEWASNRSGTKPKEYRVRFPNPDNAKQIIEWKTKKFSPGTWPEKPLLLDFESDQWVVFSDVADSGGCHIYSKYLFKNGFWTEENLPREFEARKTNLLIYDYEGMPELVNLETKRRLNADVTAAAFAQVGPKHPYCR